MSRMTKYLKQYCSVELPIMQNGVPKFNAFGEIEYQPPGRRRCRHELSSKDVQTANGSIVQSASVYYLDDSKPIMVDARIDGHVVVAVSSYVGGAGQVEGYEVYV